MTYDPAEPHEYEVRRIKTAWWGKRRWFVYDLTEDKALETPWYNKPFAELHMNDLIRFEEFAKRHVGHLKWNQGSI